MDECIHHVDKNFRKFSCKYDLIKISHAFKISRRIWIPHQFYPKIIKMYKKKNFQNSNRKECPYRAILNKLPQLDNPALNMS